MSVGRSPYIPLTLQYNFIQYLSSTNDTTLIELCAQPLAWIVLFLKDDFLLALVFFLGSALSELSFGGGGGGPVSSAKNLLHYGSITGSITFFI